ncbi:hypothetical protein ACWDV4_28910 [Micromonospora sp. NPDC003197]
MLGVLCALVGCLLIPYVLIFLVTDGEFIRDLSQTRHGSVPRQPRPHRLFAELAWRHRRAMQVVRELDRHERD